MDFFGLVEAVPLEAWGIVFGGGTAGVGLLYKTATSIRSEVLKIKEQNREERRKMYNSLAVIIGRVTSGEVKSTIEAYQHTRQSQIELCRVMLEQYSEEVVLTAGDAVRGILCKADCVSFAVVKELYMDCVKSTFPNAVLSYFIRLIGKNGFTDKSEHDYITWAREEVAPEAFRVFIASFLSRFNSEELQTRSGWIRANMDMIRMADVVQHIMLGLRDISKGHYEKLEQNEKLLVQRVTNDIKAIMSES